MKLIILATLLITLVGCDCLCGGDKTRTHMTSTQDGKVIYEGYPEKYDGSGGDMLIRYKNSKGGIERKRIYGKFNCTYKEEKVEEDENGEPGREERQEDGYYK